ncbi:MAG: gamma carbonic anhydrase family protein [Candidatus Eisenbacteria bacterium]|nr:gamma carbonic anhydrase family protein [Candidatus Eisenbacteria bacterium]
MIASFEGKHPRIGEGAWVHPSADVFGDVVIGARCWIGPGARLRGDYGAIRIGEASSVEDNCVIHARPGEICTIGDWVTIGHGAIIHNAARIDDWAVVGMGAIVSDWAKVGRWAAIGEGAVVKQRQEIPPGRIAVGIPARVLDREVDEAYKAEWTRFKETYVDLARRYPSGWVPRSA